MAGHSKRHNIKHRKAAQDAKKSKILAQASKALQLAAKQGDDPNLNPSLATALTKAKQVGLNKDAIQKAIDKGAGNIEGEELEEIYYEGYGPNGVALYIKCITPNTNRSGASVKSILTKYGGSMGAPGSVARQFQSKGEIYIDGKVETTTDKGRTIENILPLVVDEFETVLLATSAEDYEIDDGVARVITSREDFLTILNQLTKDHRHIDDSNLIFIADNEVALDTAAEEKLQTIIDALEEDEDVDTVWHNAG